MGTTSRVFDSELSHVTKLLWYSRLSRCRASSTLRRCTRTKTLALIPIFYSSFTFVSWELISCSIDTRAHLSLFKHMEPDTISTEDDLRGYVCVKSSATACIVNLTFGHAQPCVFVCFCIRLFACVCNLSV